MFFHFDSALNKPAHEWLAWALVIGVILHITVNFPVFKRHLKNRKSQIILGLFTLILALRFIPISGEKGGPVYATPIKALASAPLTTVAQVAHMSSEELLEDEAGLSADSEVQSVTDLLGNDLKKQISVLNKLLSKD